MWVTWWSETDVDQLKTLDNIKQVLPCFGHHSTLKSLANIFSDYHEWTKKLCWKFLKLSSLPSHSPWPGSPLHCKHVVIIPQTKTGTKYSTHFDPQIRKMGNFQLQKLGQTPKKCSTILTFSSHRNMVESTRTYTFNQLKRIWCNTLKLLLQKPSCQYLWVSASIHASSIVSISH